MSLLGWLSAFCFLITLTLMEGDFGIMPVLLTCGSYSPVPGAGIGCMRNSLPSVQTVLLEQMVVMVKWRIYAVMRS